MSQACAGIQGVRGEWRDAVEARLLAGDPENQLFPKIGRNGKDRETHHEHAVVGHVLAGIAQSSSAANAL
jgi:hypothetical protein